MKNFKKNFVVVMSKMFVLMAFFFAMSPCAGKMYEPKLPEQLIK